MSKLSPLLWPKPLAIWKYGIAVLSVGAALIISRSPALHLHDAPAPLLLSAVTFMRVRSFEPADN
jgi:hypothetical protein